MSVQTVIDTIRHWLGADFSVGPHGYWYNLTGLDSWTLTFPQPGHARTEETSVSNISLMQTPSFNFFLSLLVYVCVCGGGWWSFLSVFPSPFPLSFVAILDGDKHTYCTFVSCFVCFLEQIMWKRVIFFKYVISSPVGMCFCPCCRFHYYYGGGGGGGGDVTGYNQQTWQTKQQTNNNKNNNKIRIIFCPFFL